VWLTFTPSHDTRERRAYFHAVSVQRPPFPVPGHTGSPHSRTQSSPPTSPHYITTQAPAHRGTIRPYAIVPPTRTPYLISRSLYLPPPSSASPLIEGGPQLNFGVLCSFQAMSFVLCALFPVPPCVWFCDCADSTARG